MVQPIDQTATVLLLLLDNEIQASIKGYDTNITNTFSRYNKLESAGLSKPDARNDAAFQDIQDTFAHDIHRFTWRSRVHLFTPIGHDLAPRDDRVLEDA